MPANIVVPEVGESIVDARVAKWLSKAGDVVAVGDPLVELETDKIDVEVAAPQAGVLARIDHQDGADVKVGDVLGVIDEAPAATPRQAEPRPARRAGGESRRSRPSGAKAEAAARRPRPRRPRKKAAARAEGGSRERQGHRRRRPRDEARCRAGRVRPTPPAGAAGGHAGPAVARPAAPPAVAPTGATAIAPKSASACRSAARRSRGGSSRRSSTAAMLTTFNEVDMSAVMALRERHKQAFKKRHGVGLGIASFFVKAVDRRAARVPADQRRDPGRRDGAQALLRHRHRRRRGRGARRARAARRRPHVVRARSSSSIRDFAARAEDGTLTLEDLKGGTFTITNGGVFGSLLSTPILNPPQVGILGLHAIKERPVAVNGQVVDPADDVRRADLRSPHRGRLGSRPVPRAREGARRGSGRAAARLVIGGFLSGPARPVSSTETVSV